MSRVHDGWLGRVGPRPLRSDGDIVDRVVLTQAARGMLRDHLQVTGAIRGGLLLSTFRSGSGRNADSSVGSIGQLSGVGMPAASGGWAGWIDALGTLNPSVEWVGQWLIYADAQQHPSLEDAAWLEEARRLGLFGEQLVFMFAGWSEGRLAVSSYVSRDEPERLETEFGDS